MLALRVNEILKEQNKTAYWLSKQTGISSNNILKICNGETGTIRLDTAEKICNALNCTVESLFYSDSAKITPNHVEICKIFKD